MTRDPTALRIAILCSFNLSLLPPRLARELSTLSLGSECFLAPFNQHYLVALDPGSDLYAFKPDIVIFFIDVPDILPDVLAAPLDFGRAGLEARVDETSGELQDAMVAVRQGLPGAQLLVHNFALSASPSTGMLDPHIPQSLDAVVAALNRRLLDFPAALNMSVLDYAGFVRRHGWETLHDPRLWYHARMRLGTHGLDHLARLYASYIFVMIGRTKKCLVCDLDNTLWGDILGEVGVSGIALSEDGIGRAYKDAQREIVALKKRGVLLALNSRNNWDEVVDVFRDHPDMVLTLEDFSAIRVNWEDKAANLGEIAAELNIGLDGLVFVDDSAFECDLVRHALPAVTVVQVPSDPAFFPGLVRSLPWFQRLTLSEEDRRRAEMMTEETKRQALRAQTCSRDEFLRSLEMVAEFSPLTPTSLPRAAQLTQKTNQFNLTTRRYSEPELAALAGDGRHAALLVRLRDRFGDSGVVGFALLEAGGPRWRIDTFLLSCRALGRGLETAMLSGIVALARRHSAEWLLGQFIPTGRNAPASGLLGDHGFKPAGGDLWQLDLVASRIDPPPWLAIHGGLE